MHITDLSSAKVNEAGQSDNGHLSDSEINKSAFTRITADDIMPAPVKTADRMIYSMRIKGQIYTDIINTSATPNSSYYLNRAECYVNTDRFSRAAADLHAIEGEERENPYFYILRGRLRLDQFDKFAARADFEKAKQLGYDAELADKWIGKTR